VCVSRVGVCDDDDDDVCVSRVGVCDDDGGVCVSRVGVCVDRPAGTLFFYSVSESDTLTVLHTFHTHFTEHTQAHSLIYTHSFTLTPTDTLLHTLGPTDTRTLMHTHYHAHILTHLHVHTNFLG
ncbi:hypothetical protein SKAU_G00154030, partial [Synaphobranchus kaupii]